MCLFSSATVAASPRKDVKGVGTMGGRHEIVVRKGDRRGKQSAPWFCDPLTRSITPLLLGVTDLTLAQNSRRVRPFRR